MKRTLSLWGCVLLLASLVTNLFAQSFDESKLYTIESNNNAGKFMQDNGGGTIVAKAYNKNSFWRLLPQGTKAATMLRTPPQGATCRRPVSMKWLLRWVLNL